MADRAPLLEYEEGPAVTFPPWDGSSLAPGNGAGSAPGPHSLSGGAAESWSPGSEREAAAAPGAQQQEEEEQVVAVFVVTFDTRAGNIIEWCLPHEVDLEGVEFKSMASGSHRINSDFVYFRKGNYFGMACFANMPVESELERGARMKSVGILSPSYTLLYRYMHFLENQVRHQLEIPGHYAQLEAFYEDKKGVLPAGMNKGIPTSFQPLHWLPSVNKYMYPEMKITHPAGCMSQFIKFFGEQIMVLWKFALLRKRILIFSPPPVGVVCYRVYCCCCLANVSLPGIGGVPESKPYFYVSVADIETLETEVSYVACTTEKIFEEKKDLYDVYVDNQNVKTDREHLQQLLKVNSADKDKYRKLNDQRLNYECKSTYTYWMQIFPTDKCYFILRRWGETAAPMKKTCSLCFSWNRTIASSRCCWKFQRARIKH
ncbi:DENN domain-containing protein 11 isoform X2 [Cetorhinus maximus]